MAAASDVTFDVLLGGKVTPQLLKSFKDLEDLMKKQGATAKTINAVMGRAYKETFEGVSKEAKKDFGEVEKSGKHAFTELIAQAREAQHKVVESFDKIKESMEGLHKFADHLFEFTGVGALLTAVGGAITIEELVKKGIEVHRARATEQETLAATLRGRGRGLETGEWAEAAEKIASQAHIGHTEAMELMTKLAASGRFGEAGQARQMALSLIGLGGGTAEGAQGALAAYQRMMLTGQVNPRMVAMLGRGSGINVLQQLSQDTGIPVEDLKKQFAQAKISKRTGEVTGGALAGAKGINALNKAILELGQSRGMELIQAHMKGMDGLFYRFSEHWEDFTDKLGEFIEKIIDPIGEEINKLIDSIDFSAAFDAMIEKGKEWGQLIKAVWDTIANSPILNRIKAMWQDFWKTFTGGVELYGPYVETWNDKLHHELGTHMARHMTEAGRQWVKATSERIEGFIKGIIDAFSWFKDNWKSIADGLWAIAEAFVGMKIAGFVVELGSLTKALFGLGAASDAATAAVGATTSSGLVGALVLFTGYMAILTKNMLSFLGTPEGQKMSKDLERARMHPGEGAADVVQSLSAASGYTTPAARAAAQQGLEYAARTNDKAAEAALRHADSLEKLNALNEQVRKTQEMHNKALQEATKSASGLDDQLHKTTGNDLVHFDAAITQATQSLLQLSSGFGALGGGGGMFGIGSSGGAVSGAHFTEYGPAVAGDQPGGPTYDWNSYHHVGAWPAITGPLRAGDVALGYGAQAKYHVMPGQLFTDEYGRTWRFADRSGSKDPFNVDVFKFAMGGIFRKPTQAVIGESGPEAVLPLSGVGAAAAGLGGITINVNVAGNAHDPDAIGEAVERVIRQHWRRQAVV